MGRLDECRRGSVGIIAPFAAGYYSVNSVATTESVVAGLLTSGFGLWLAADDAPHYIDYLLALFGIWSAAAPFVLSYRDLTTAFYSDVSVGVVVFLAAIASMYYRSYGASALRQKTT
jgi:hypothetical protein